MLPDLSSKSSRAKSALRYSLLLLCAFAARGGPTSIPAGTAVHVRLNSEISSSKSTPGQPVSFVVIEPVFLNGQLVIGAGAVIDANIREVHRASGDDPALIGVHFATLTPVGGKAVTFAAQVKQVDNARETVDADGNIVGIIASKTLTAEADRGISKLSQNYSELAGILQAAKSVLVKPADPEIDYGVGVEMTLAINRDFVIDGPPQTGPQLAPFPAPEPALTRLVLSQPLRAYSINPPIPSDLTNLMLIGSETRIHEAFEKAGWSTASSLGRDSKLETIRAVVEDRGYKEGPVSILTLNGRPPDFVFQKTNDTFAARHHLRLWRTNDTFAGQPVWDVTATHDIGISFSERDRTFIHKIESNIDAERSKVVNDLLFTGLVRSLALVNRRDLPANPTNATGDSLVTDGRMAVILLAP